MRDMVLSAVTSFEWSADATALYYTTADDTGRPSKVRRACDSTVDVHHLHSKSAAVARQLRHL